MLSSTLFIHAVLDSPPLEIHQDDFMRNVPEMINTIETGIGIGLFPIIGIGIGIGLKQTLLIGIGIGIGKFLFWLIGFGIGIGKF